MGIHSAPVAIAVAPPLAWAKLLSNGAYGNYDVGAAKFNDVFRKSGDFVIKRICSNCRSDYKEVYYRRYTSPTAFAPYDYMKMNWFSSNNVLNKDFGIFSSYADAIAKRNPWRFCNYNDPGVGFPRDCGKTGYVAHQWNAFPGSRHAGGSRSVAYYIHSAPVAIAVAPPLAWAKLLSNGAYGNYDVGAAKFNDVFRKSGDFVIKRICSNCRSDYKEVYYRRYTSPTAFAPYDYMKMNWFSRNNVLNKDFGIFSSYADAIAKRNPWRFCNYNDPGVGFPRDCGKTGSVAHQWNAFPGSRHAGGSRSLAYYTHSA